MIVKLKIEAVTEANIPPRGQPNNCHNDYAKYQINRSHNWKNTARDHKFAPSLVT